MDSAEITRDELLELISVKKGAYAGGWQVYAVRGDVMGNVQGNVAGYVGGSVGGDVGGSVGGDVHGDVKGDVFGDVGVHVTGSVGGDVGGNVVGSVLGTVRGQIYSSYQLGLVASQQQMYWVSLVGWEVWDAWYASRADVRSAADGVVAASKKMAAANHAERSAWLAMKEAARASPLFNEASHAHHRAERITRDY